jgi:opacity protein-like surface antigen
MKSIISIAVTTCILSATSICYAESQSDINSSGIYITAGVGLPSTLQHNIDGSFIYPLPTLPTRYFAMTTNKDDPFSEIGLGVGMKIFHNYYLGMEASYDYLFNSNSNSAVDQHTGGFDTIYYQTSDQNQANAQVIFGRTLWGHWLAFLTSGLNIDWRKNTLSQNSTGIPVDDPNNPGYRGNVHLYEFGLIIGGGLRIPIYKRLELSASYRYIDYFNNNYTVILNSASPAYSDSVTYHMHDRSYSNNFIGSIIWRI